MRIISGKHKGLKLEEFNLNNIRPTLDRVKESVFNIIQFKIEGSIFLDLFGGTGAIGFEAASRFAKKVFIVDNNPNSIKLIKKNSLKINSNVEIIESEYDVFLKKCKTKFDIIYLDPPYNKDFLSPAIDLIEKSKLLSDGGVIITEHENGENFKLDSKYFEIKDVRKYGSVVINIIGIKP